MARSHGGKTLEGQVRDITHGGDAVVETAEGIVMMRGALPGERVRLRLGERRKGVARGELLELLERSAERVEPACAYVGRCGGCPLMTLAPTAQHALKRAHLQAALADGEAPEVQMHTAGEGLAYRGRARLGFAVRGQRRTLGYRAPGSKRLVDVDACPILEPPLQRALQAARAVLLPTLEGAGDIALGLGADGRAVLHLQSSDSQPPAVYRAAEALVGEGALAGVALALSGAAPARFGEPRQQTRTPAGEALWAAPDGFAQANPQVNALLVATALELAEPHDADVLELYAGHGNFTVGLARVARRLSAVEADPEAVRACQDNLARLGLSARARVRCESAEVASRGGPVDVVLLDPPRTGAREALAGIVARKPRRIVYVSCDPATLRRDLAPLRQAGYGVDAAHGFEMFPHTPHVEAVVRLVRLAR